MGMLLMLKEGKNEFRIDIDSKGTDEIESSVSLFEDEAEKDDHVIDDRLLVHKMNELYLLGVEIDYDSEIFGSTFKFNNPRAKSQCGCGTSFSI